MIPIQRFKEPSYFDSKVRMKGQSFLKKYNGKVPYDVCFPDYWTACKDDLYSNYKGICAYTCLHIHKMTSNPNVEHIKPKRLFPHLAYEWENYCLACSRINARKGERLNIIDPFDVKENMFFLVLETGHIYANPKHPDRKKAEITIKELDLDNQLWACSRRDYFICYRSFIADGLKPTRAETFLKAMSPFVWYEAKRQNRLK